MKPHVTGLEVSRRYDWCRDKEREIETLRETLACLREAQESVQYVKTSWLPSGYMDNFLSLVGGVEAWLQCEEAELEEIEKTFGQSDRDWTAYGR